MEALNQGDEYSTPIPQGATVGAPPAPSAQDEYSTPIPQGASVQSVPDNRSLWRKFTDAWKHADSVHNTYNLEGSEPGQGLPHNVVTGMEKGAADTLSDASQLAGKAADKLGLRNKSLTDTITGQQRGIFGEAPTGDETKTQGFEESVLGYGGESLVEFLAGDEALKGLSIAERLSKVASVMKIFENSPRLVNALKMGASAGKAMGELSPEERALVQKSPLLTRLIGAGMDAVRAGTVQGGQTFVHTKGDVGESVKDALTMAGTSGVIGGVTGTAGHILKKAGDTASKVGELSDKAEAAASREEVANKLAKNIDAAKDELHQKYEAGINDLKKRLKGVNVDYEGSPLHKAAQDLTNQGEAEAKPLDEAFSQARPGSKKVNDMVDKLANPGAEEEEEAAADEWVDANGVKHTEPPAPKEEQPPITMNVDELIERRQLLGQRMRKLGYATSEDRADRDVYRSLIQGIDDTIGKLAEKSGDQSVVADYDALRTAYRSKINLFDDPVIEKIREGKVDDAAKQFVAVQKADSALPSGGKVRYNTEVLRQILGDDGLKSFGKDVFGSMMKDSFENGKFNPAKFAKSWNRIADETKSDLFDINAANNGLNALAKDAKSAAVLQHLSRAGILAGVGGAAGHFSAVGMGIGSLIGFTVSEGGSSFQKGREMLNYIANHPAAWGTYEVAGKLANSKAAKAASRATQVGVGKGAVETRRAVFSGAASSLSQ